MPGAKAAGGAAAGAARSANAGMTATSALTPAAARLNPPRNGAATPAGHACPHPGRDGVPNLLELRMSRTPTLRRRALGATLSLLLPAAALAGPTQASLSTPGGYASACASAMSSSSSFLPGVDLEAPFAFFPGQFSCQSQTFSGAGGQADAGASHVGSNGSLNSASAQALMGEIHLQAQNQSRLSDNFAVGAAAGGWKDILRIVDDALVGQAGVWLFEVDIDGLFSVGGGNARVLMSAFKNNSELSNRVADYDPGQSDRFTTDVQRVAWGKIGSGDRTVDDRVIFAVPIVYGQDFSWGVYATTMAGQSSFAPALTNVRSRAMADFSHTLRYAGSLGVMVNGTLRTDATLVSRSGFDWGSAAGGVNTVPEPGAGWLAVMGLLPLAACRKGRRC